MRDPRKCTRTHTHTHNKKHHVPITIMHDGLENRDRKVIE